MIGLRGRLKGQHLKMVQFSNDWISADTDDGKSIIVTPTSVQLEPDEAELFINDVSNSGTFWDEYELDENKLRFSRKSWS